MNKSYVPKIRQDNIMVTRVGDEIVVYDEKTSEASCLDAMTTVVWEACDGSNDLAQILELLQDAGFSDSNTASIWHAIDFLDQAKLLEDQPLPGEKERSKRRELFRMLSLGAIGGSPLISTVFVPPAIAMMSCIPNFNAPCDQGGIPCCAPRVCVRVGNTFRCRNP